MRILPAQTRNGRLGVFRRRLPRAFVIAEVASIRNPRSIRAVPRAKMPSTPNAEITFCRATPPSTASGGYVTAHSDAGMVRSRVAAPCCYPHKRRDAARPPAARCARRSRCLRTTHHAFRHAGLCLPNAILFAHFSYAANGGSVVVCRQRVGACFAPCCRCATVPVYARVGWHGAARTRHNASGRQVAECM